MADGKDQQCQAITKGGKRCGGTPVPGDVLCPWHAPAWAERRRQWSQRGGTNRSNRARARKGLPDPMGLNELRSVLSVTVRGVLAGKVEPGVGNCVANLARALKDVTEAAALEDFGERLAELERVAGGGRAS